jgi:hypothetical protein
MRQASHVFLVTLVVTTVGLALPAAAQFLSTLTLDNVPADVECDEVWQEEGIDLYFSTTTAEDCDGGGACFFGVDVGAVWLYPSRLVVDLGATYDVISVEIDVDDYCGSGCTRAFLYDGASVEAQDQNAATGPDTLVLVPGSGQGDRIAVSSCEGQVLEIRITTTTVAADPTTWTDIKALYR